MSLTVGIDLASQPRRTAACVIEWAGEKARPSLIEQPLDDAALLELMLGKGVQKVGIDAPFGWPAAFVAAVSSYDSTGSWPMAERDSDGWTRDVVLRATDHFVREQTGKNALSVSTDKIAYCAMRCARLLSELGSSGRKIDRSGVTGLVAEVYPDTAIRAWALRCKAWEIDRVGYKGQGEANVKRRAQLVKRLRTATKPWLEADPAFWKACRESDDQLDAFVSALVARTVQVGATIGPEDSALARREGWIHLPVPGSLDALNGDAS